MVTTSLAKVFPRRVLFHRPKPTRLQVVAMAVKRSPKRLKYCAHRFTAVWVGGLLYVEAHPSGADSWKQETVVELLKEEAVGLIATDSVYAIVCDSKSHSAIERLCKIKNIEPSKPLSIFSSFRDIDMYTTGFSRGDGQGHANIFRSVKHCLRGPIKHHLGTVFIQSQMVQFCRFLCNRKKFGILRASFVLPIIKL